MPPVASPSASRGDGASRRGGRPLAEWLPMGKGSRRLRRGSSDGGADEARGVTAGPTMPWREIMTHGDATIRRNRGSVGSEIVYPCIPNLDREDEGGQASSSLAVSTRWISAAKLLQSDLATLAQREGGE
ncbi:hypothetical protein BHM03_00054020 [Ensete ventricosum]|nr:hypothetical protein BHM03_00054020 [Ensete ventricosum]